jgi:hypothetical protein
VLFQDDKRKAGPSTAVGLCAWRAKLNPRSG